MVAAGSAQGDLEQGALPGQRGAQLMRRVGREPPLGVERCLQPREQVVEGVGEFPELVVGSAQGQSLVQVAGRDPAGGGSDRAQRAQYPAGDIQPIAAAASAMTARTMAQMIRICRLS